MRTAPLWCAPIFIGTALIGVWLYQERSHAGGAMLWAAVGAAWCIVWVGGTSMGRNLDRRRLRIDEVLSDLS